MGRRIVRGSGIVRMGGRGENGRERIAEWLEREQKNSKKVWERRGRGENGREGIGRGADTDAVTDMFCCFKGNPPLWRGS